jgi:uncharacterized protein YndB with AHSA1/START domain
MGVVMESRITLAIDVEAAPQLVFDILSSAEGQRAFWTTDCDVSSDRARFGFGGAPVDLEVAVTLDPGRLVRMRVTSGFPHWKGSTWEWELSPASDPSTGSVVLFRHYGFEEGYEESGLGHTAEAWALVLDRLARFLASGTPQPFFSAVRPS